LEKTDFRYFSKILPDGVDMGYGAMKYVTARGDDDET
jgi:hypothetical protein